MRWWDASARLKAGLAALNALGLGLAGEGWLRAAAAAAAGILAALVVRSLRLGRPAGTLAIDRVPVAPGGLYVGRGFEWTAEASEETVATGRPATRSERDLFIPDGALERHVLILGTTGVGKTRLLELLALQAIARGDAVVVIDPKGDARLLERLRRAAGLRFRLFDLADPARSVRYNPVGRYLDVREVADRVAALLPSAGDALPFRNFAWDIVYRVAREIEGKHPMTLRNLKRFGIDHPVKPLSEHPRDHYAKMASSLAPVLSKLGSELLSPPRGGLSWEEVDRDRQVVYFSLGALLAGESAGAVAKMTLLDLQSFVGARYAVARDRGLIWVFVDELGDVVTPEFTSLLGKSRGAGFRVAACAQTPSDVEAALGSRARALQVFGNASTVFQLRAPSAADASAFAEAAGERLVRMRSEAATYEPALLSSGFQPVDDFRARFGETVEWREHALVPAWAVAELPVFHFFARWEGKVWRGRVPWLR